MTAWSDLSDSIRKIILMQDKLDRLAGGIAGVADQVVDHERRLIRIETMIEMAQGRPGGPRRLK